MSVVHILNSTYSKDGHIIHLEGKANRLADDLSCDDLSHFFSHVPQVEHRPPSHIPAAFLDLLDIHHHIWTSTDWIRLFGDTMKQL